MVSLDRGFNDQGWGQGVGIAICDVQLPVGFALGSQSPWNRIRFRVLGRNGNFLVHASKVKQKQD